MAVLVLDEQVIKGELFKVKCKYQWDRNFVRKDAHLIEWAEDYTSGWWYLHNFNFYFKDQGDAVMATLKFT